MSEKLERGDKVRVWLNNEMLLYTESLGEYLMVTTIDNITDSYKNVRLTDYDMSELIYMLQKELNSIIDSTILSEPFELLPEFICGLIENMIYLDVFCLENDDNHHIGMLDDLFSYEGEILAEMIKQSLVPWVVHFTDDFDLPSKLTSAINTAIFNVLSTGYKHEGRNNDYNHMLKEVKTEGCEVYQIPLKWLRMYDKNKLFKDKLKIVLVSDV